MTGHAGLGREPWCGANLQAKEEREGTALHCTSLHCAQALSARTAHELLRTLSLSAQCIGLAEGLCTAGALAGVKEGTYGLPARPWGQIMWPLRNPACSTAYAPRPLVE